MPESLSCGSCPVPSDRRWQKSHQEKLWYSQLVLQIRSRQSCNDHPDQHPRDRALFASLAPGVHAEVFGDSVWLIVIPCHFRILPLCFRGGVLSSSHTRSNFVQKVCDCVRTPWVRPYILLCKQRSVKVKSWGSLMRSLPPTISASAMVKPVT